MSFLRRHRWVAGVASLLLGGGAWVAATADADPRGDTVGVQSRNEVRRCPAGTPVITGIADYDDSRPIAGAATPEQALEFWLSRAYPNAPRGQFKKRAIDDRRTLFEQEDASALLQRIQDRQVLPIAQREESWVVRDFVLCQKTAERWVAR